jgi:hypothetical protein
LASPAQPFRVSDDECDDAEIPVPGVSPVSRPKDEAGSGVGRVADCSVRREAGGGRREAGGGRRGAKVPPEKEGGNIECPGKNGACTRTPR